MAEAAHRRHAKGNGNYKPTLADVYAQLEAHEVVDKDAHATTGKAIEEMSDAVKELTKSVTGLANDRAIREAVEKKTRNIYIGLITVAGIVIPIAIPLLQLVLGRH
jgi:hypothetical protein